MLAVHPPFSSLNPIYRDEVRSLRPTRKMWARRGFVFCCFVSIFSIALIYGVIALLGDKFGLDAPNIKFWLWRDAQGVTKLQETLFVHSSGELGVNTDSPGATLDVHAPREGSVSLLLSSKHIGSGSSRRKAMSSLDSAPDNTVASLGRRQPSERLTAGEWSGGQFNNTLATDDNLRERRLGANGNSASGWGGALADLGQYIVFGNEDGGSFVKSAVVGADYDGILLINASKDVQINAGLGDEGGRILLAASGSDKVAIGMTPETERAFDEKLFVRGNALIQGALTIGHNLSHIMNSTMSIDVEGALKIDTEVRSLSHTAQGRLKAEASEAEQAPAFILQHGSSRVSLKQAAAPISSRRLQSDNSDTVVEFPRFSGAAVVADDKGVRLPSRCSVPLTR
jgi:hypothetical protein